MQRDAVLCVAHRRRRSSHEEKKRSTRPQLRESEKEERGGGRFLPRSTRNHDRPRMWGKKEPELPPRHPLASYLDQTQAKSTHALSRLCFACLSSCISRSLSHCMYCMHACVSPRPCLCQPRSLFFSQHVCAHGATRTGKPLTEKNWPAGLLPGLRRLGDARHKSSGACAPLAVPGSDPGLGEPLTCDVCRFGPLYPPLQARLIRCLQLGATPSDAQLTWSTLARTHAHRIAATWATQSTHGCRSSFHA